MIDDFIAVKEYAMLVLSQKKGQKIYVGNDITVTTLEVGLSALLRIEVPPNYEVKKTDMYVKKNERIRIGKDIFLTIVDVRGGTIRLGFEAPNHVKVFRSELIEKR